MVRESARATNRLEQADVDERFDSPAPGVKNRKAIDNLYENDQADLTRLHKHMRQLKWCLGLTIAGWFMAALTGADPRYTPPFAISFVACLAVMLVTSSRIRKLANSRRA